MIEEIEATTSAFLDIDSPAIVVLHASAVSVDGRALIFLGPAETGKTTISRLLGTRMQSLADDLLALVPREDDWRVVNVEGNAGVVQSKDSPRLWAACRLYQAKSPRLEQIDEAEMCCHLTNAFFEARWQCLYDWPRKRGSFALLADIARRIPGYRLHFELSSQTIEMVEAFLHEKGGV